MGRVNCSRFLLLTPGEGVEDRTNGVRGVARREGAVSLNREGFSSDLGIHSVLFLKIISASLEYVAPLQTWIVERVHWAFVYFTCIPRFTNTAFPSTADSLVSTFF